MHAIEKILAKNSGREKVTSGEIITAKVDFAEINDLYLQTVYSFYEMGGENHEIPTDNIILATGHSASDVFYMLESLGIPMEAKGFGVGVRIEHPREYINRLVYGENAPDGVQTYGYYLYVKTQGAKSVAEYPILSAMGVLMTVVVVPVTMLVKQLLEKYGPSED
jgi:uncharacterized FAD-dependent dehydrogenase